MKLTKKIILPLALTFGALSAVPAMAADMSCYINAKNGGQTWGNGTSNCSAFDFSFGNSTSGRYIIKNMTKPVKKISWIKGCSSGTSCTVNVRAYSVNSGEAYIHYTDGSIEFVSAYMDYETGH